MEDERQLRFYCPEHKIDFVARARGVAVFCGNKADEHALTRDFPGEGFWEYCCDCERFLPLRQPQQDDGAGNDRCPNCERPSVTRFLCSTCFVVSFKSWESVVPAPTHRISATGRIQPHCPACLTKASVAVRIHECRLQRMGFTTTRASCPFCKEAIQPDVADAVQEFEAETAASVSVTALAEAPPQLKAAEPVLQLTAGNGHAPAALEAGGEVAPAGSLGRFRDGLASLRHRKVTLGSAALVIPLLLYPFQEPIKGWLYSLYVLATNNKPVVEEVEGHKTVCVGGSIKLKGRAKDADGETLSFRWEPPPGVKIEGEGETVTLNLANSDVLPGEKLKVMLVVKDTQGGESEPYAKEISVVSNHDPQFSSITAVPQQVTVGHSVRLSTSVTDPDGDTPTYEWSCSSGWFEGNHTNSATVILNTTGVSVAPSTSVNIKVTVTARDGRGGNSSKDIDVSVFAPPEAAAPSPTPQNAPPDDKPQAVIAPPERLTITAGDNLRLLANATDRSGDNLTYEWHAGNTSARIEGNGQDVTLNTSGLKALTEPLRLRVTLVVKNFHGGVSPPTYVDVEVRPREPAGVGPVPSAHPEPSATASPTPSPSTSPEAKPSGR